MPCSRSGGDKFSHVRDFFFNTVTHATQVPSQVLHTTASGSSSIVKLLARLNAPRAFDLILVILTIGNLIVVTTSSVAVLTVV